MPRTCAYGVRERLPPDRLGAKELKEAASCIDAGIGMGVRP